VNSHFLVCEYDRELLARMGGKSLVLNLRDVDDISDVYQDSQRYDFHIHCLNIETGKDLTDIAVKEDWDNLPIALHVKSLGKFREFVLRLPVIRKLNIRIYLPTDNPENFTSARILSSLGVDSAVELRSEGIDWEAATDLMTYSLLGMVPHAPIDPFQYIAEKYDPGRNTDFGAVYFDDPRTYLYINNDGKIAASKRELKDGVFLADGIDDLDRIEESDAYRARLGNWMDHFGKPDGCAYCPAWRVCLGKFSKTAKDDPGCRNLFSEIMDVVEQFQSRQNGDRHLWRP